MKRESLHPKGQSVDFILRNEKYVGDCEMQKTVTVDFLSHKTIPNNGEAPKFYVTDHHVPIINRTVWGGVRTKSWTKQRSQGGNRYIVHIRKESPRPAII